MFANAVTLSIADAQNNKFFKTQNALVLDEAWQPIGKTSWQDAISAVFVGKAEVIAFRDIKIHHSTNMPLVIKWNKEIRRVWKKQVPWSKLNIHIRDGWTCQYCGCGVTEREATIDHVVPRDAGGKNSWLNTVCSCFACNNKKENRTPSQADMTLLRQPFQPTIAEFIARDVENSGGAHLLEIVWEKMMK